MQNFCPIRRIKYRFGLYNRQKNRRRIYFTYIILIFVFLSFVLISGSMRLFEFALALGEDMHKNDVLHNCSKIVSEIINNCDAIYDDIYDKKIDNNGKITSISTDFNKVNSIKATVDEALSSYLNSINRLECNVPIGTLLSNDIFAAWGFSLPVPLLISSDAEVEFIDSFIDAGINQTKYLLMIRINVSSKIHTATKSVESTTVIDLPISESVIVGDVPKYIMPNLSTE